jgi:hypothetical protein
LALATISSICSFISKFGPQCYLKSRSSKPVFPFGAE